MVGLMPHGALNPGREAEYITLAGHGAWLA